MAFNEYDREMPRSDRVRDARELEEQSPLRRSIEPGEYRQATTREAEMRVQAGQRFEQNGVLPTVRFFEGQENRGAMDRQSVRADRLLDGNIPAENRLRAVEELGRQGARSVQVRDADGSVKDCRVELQQVGNRTMVHLYAQGSDGKEHVVLRGISNGDGTYSHEKDRNGREVGYEGTWWTQNMRRDVQSSDRPIVTQPFPGMEQRPETAMNPRQTYRGFEIPTLPPRPNQNAYEQLAPVPPVPNYNAYERMPVVPPRQNFNAYEQQPQRPYNNYYELPGRRNDAELNYHFDAVSQIAARGGDRRMHQLPDGSVYFRSGMAIDADGAPDARRIDPTGSTRTSLRYGDGSSVNAHNVPYFVLPAGRYKQYGIRPGDIAAVRHNGRVDFAVFADVGPSHKLGEGSMALARELGINSNPRHGGVQHGVEYIVFPRSGDRTPGNPERTRDLGAQQLTNRAQWLRTRYRV